MVFSELYNEYFKKQQICKRDLVKKYIHLQVIFFLIKERDILKEASFMASFFAVHYYI
ncbi:hypothetical protein C8P67_110127 [Flavobacterium aquicola]|uniref:Uncharacterized protein n=1 Tax=Flavobacterium aquicola TaxID=1682742 RepID=A0A3E0EDI9_9FLAO|nr:hypothetical protein C8P67_110127 [Flavobacterium aquicola]